MGQYQIPVYVQFTLARGNHQLQIIPTTGFHPHVLTFCQHFRPVAVGHLLQYGLLIIPSTYIIHITILAIGRHTKINQETFFTTHPACFALQGVIIVLKPFQNILGTGFQRGLRQNTVGIAPIPIIPSRFPKLHVHPTATCCQLEILKFHSSSPRTKADMAGYIRSRISCP